MLSRVLLIDSMCAGVSHRGRASSTRVSAGYSRGRAPARRADVAAPMVGRGMKEREKDRESGRQREREVDRASRRCSVAPRTKSPGATARQCRARDRGERTRIPCVPCIYRARLNTRLILISHASRERLTYGRETYARASERASDRAKLHDGIAHSSSSGWTIAPKKKKDRRFCSRIYKERSMSILNRGVPGSRGVFL